MTIILLISLVIVYVTTFRFQRSMKDRASVSTLRTMSRSALKRQVDNTNGRQDIRLIKQRESTHVIPDASFRARWLPNQDPTDDVELPELTLEQLFLEKYGALEIRPTVVTGPSGVGKSYCLGRFAEILYSHGFPFAYLQASSLELVYGENLVASLARLVAYQYNIEHSAATSAITSGLLTVILDSLAELGDHDREQVVKGLNQVAAEPGDMVLFLGVRSDVAASDGLDLEQWNTISIDPLPLDKVDRFARDVVGLSTGSQQLATEEFRSPLALHVLAESGLDDEQLAVGPVSLAYAWKSLADRRLVNKRTRQDEIRTLNWIGSVVRNVIPGSVVQLESLNPNWVPETHEVKARRLIGAAVGVIFAPFGVAFLMALYFSILQSMLIVFLAVLVVYPLYWVRPTWFQRGRRMVLNRRSWSAKKLRGDEERRSALLRAVEGAGNGIGVGLFTLIVSRWANEHFGEPWLIGLAAIFFVGSVLWPGGAIGLQTGCFAFSVAIGFMSNPFEAFAIPFVGGLIAGSVFGISDSGEVVVSSKPGDSQSIGRAFARSFTTTLRFEIGQYVAFGGSFGLAASLLSGQWEWLRFGLVGALVGIVIFGLVGGIMPWLDHYFGVRALESHLALDDKLIEALRQLCRHGLAIEVSSHSYRLFHDSMPDLQLENRRMATR